MTRDDDGLNANQALVKAGLATPMTVGANSTYRREMDSAYNVAQAMQVGFFDPEAGLRAAGESASPGTTTSSTASPEHDAESHPVLHTPLRRRSRRLLVVEDEVTVGDPAPSPIRSATKLQLRPAPAQPAAPQLPAAPLVPGAVTRV